MPFRHRTAPGSLAKSAIVRLPLERLALRRARLSAQVCVCVSSGAIIPERAPASIDMLQTVIALPSRARLWSAAVLDRMTGAAGDADLPDDREDEVLRRDAGADRS